MKQFTMETLNAIAKKAVEMVKSFKMAEYDTEHNGFYDGWYCLEDDDEFNFIVGRVSFEDMMEWDSLRKWAEKMLDTELLLEVRSYFCYEECEGMKVVIRRKHPLLDKLSFDDFKKEVERVARVADCLYGEVRNYGEVYKAILMTDTFGGVFAEIVYNPSTRRLGEGFKGVSYDSFYDFAMDAKEESTSLKKSRAKGLSELLEREYY